MATLLAILVIVSRRPIARPYGLPTGAFTVPGTGD
jgi:hypothetical protein